MNREQMIAWLTLEGWDPCIDCSDAPLLRQSELRLWITESGAALFGVKDNIGKGYLGSEETIPWSDISDEHLTTLYARAILEGEFK